VADKVHRHLRDAVIGVIQALPRISAQFASAVLMAVTVRKDDVSAAD